jgi:TonB family protein
MNRNIVLILLIFAFFLRATIMLGDDMEDVERILKSTFEEKVLTARHFYEGGRLKFDADGTLEKNTPEGSWTLYGRIEVNHVKLQGKTLEIKGKRVFMQYDPNQDKLVGRSGSTIKIEIKTGGSSLKFDSLSKTLYKVFLSPNENLADITPPYWKNYLLANGNSKIIESRTRESDGERVYKIIPNGDVIAPVEIYAPSPIYSLEQMLAIHQGTTYLSLVVNAGGSTEDISIVRPLGQGMDEITVETVRKWRFKPGLRKGTPVPVRLSLFITTRMP